jgi:hypothetical protein
MVNRPGVTHRPQRLLCARCFIGAPTRIQQRVLHKIVGVAREGEHWPFALRDVLKAVEEPNFRLMRELLPLDQQRSGDASTGRAQQVRADGQRAQEGVQLRLRQVIDSTQEGANSRTRVTRVVDDVEQLSRGRANTNAALLPRHVDAPHRIRFLLYRRSALPVERAGQSIEARPSGLNLNFAGAEEVLERIVQFLGNNKGQSLLGEELDGTSKWNDALQGSVLCNTKHLAHRSRIGDLHPTSLGPENAKLCRGAS